MKNYHDGGEAIVEALRNLGIKYVISSPGSEWSPVWEALTRQKHEKNHGPEYIQCWHEALAVNMATGYTWITGEAQAVLLHAGVGLLQGAMGIRCAMQAEVPMLVMSGESVTLGADQDLAIEPQWYGGVSPGGADKLVAPFVKWASHVPSAQTLYQCVIRAGEMAARAPQGPIYLDVPLEHMLEDWSPVGELHAVPPAPATQAGEAELEALVAEIRSANNPMIVADISGRDAATFPALVSLAEAAAIPVIGGRGTSYANFPTDHELWLGVENYGPLADADLIVLVGGRTPWYPPKRRPGPGRITAIGDHPHKEWLIYQELHADAYLEGDIAATLAALTAKLVGSLDEGAVDARRAKWAGISAEAMGTLQETRDAVVAADKLNPASIAEAMRAVMPADAIFVDETITHFPVLRKHLPMTRPQTLFRHTGGALGQGLGLALGVKLAAPERPVVLFIGDGGLLYNPITQAFGASREHELPIIIVVMNNGHYKAMKKGHVHHYPDGMAAATELTMGIEIQGPDYEDLGSNFGILGVRTETYRDFRTALAEALATTKSGNSAIINAVLPD
ncbi:MAG: thiamine pyrophosphate-binding protein [Pseudomonadota bacterium]|nr:thiamine pyrophosphate-binding protein [Pseudomonadota bacterium]